MPDDQLILLPILIPLTGAVVALLLRRRSRLQAVWALGVMVGALSSSLFVLAGVWSGDRAFVFQPGGWPAPFGITLVADPLSAFLVAMSQLVLTLGVLYALGARDYAVRFPAFYPLFLTLATSLTGALLTGDLFNLFVFAELLVISGAVLTAISDDRFGVEAAYKYFYISLLASVFFLLGIGGLYVSYGTLNMADLAGRVSADPAQPLLPFAIAMLTATFMVKSAVFPLHVWQPDFHQAASTPVSAMLSSVVVKLGVYGFLRMTTLLFVDQAAALRVLLIGLGVVGVAFGGLSAVGTGNVKRMLAYSTVAQVGFILVAIGWGTPLALVAALVFTFNHSLIKAAMLMMAGALASRAPVKSASFDVVTGVGRRLPFMGTLFLIGGLALAGIPPTNGFISKLVLFRSGLETGAYLSLAGLAIASLLTLVYIVRAFMRIWWESPSDGKDAKPSGDRLLAPALLVLAVIVLGFWPDPLIQLAQHVSSWMASPLPYIQYVLGGV